jgi:hypothetical protein
MRMLDQCLHLVPRPSHPFWSPVHSTLSSVVNKHTEPKHKLYNQLASICLIPNYHAECWKLSSELTWAKLLAERIRRLLQSLSSVSKSNFLSAFSYYHWFHISNNCALIDLQFVMINISGGTPCRFCIHMHRDMLCLLIYIIILLGSICPFHP